MPIQAQFEVVVRVHTRLKLIGRKPGTNLFVIGRELGLDDAEIKRIAGRAVYSTKRQGTPQSVDDRRWVQPTPDEERALQMMDA